MAEYIERMSAIATACKMCNKEFPNEPCDPADCSIQQGLFKIPTADVAEVVRCKDCDVPHNRWLGCPNLNGLVPPPDFYCAKGKRKMDGVTDTNVGKMDGKDDE